MVLPHARGGSSVAAALAEAPVAATVIRLTGELDIAAVDALTRLLEVATADFDDELVLDLADVTFLDCSGLKPLLEARNLVGDGLRLHRPSRAVTRLLELTHLHATFQVTEATGQSAGESKGNDVSWRHGPPT